MQYIIDSPDSKIVDDIDITHPCIVCNQSLKNAVNVHDSQSVSRLKIVDEVSELIQNANSVIIKWQYSDSKMKIPQKLFERFPSVRHRIFVLHVDPHLYESRLSSRDWWESIDDKQSFMNLEKKLVDESIYKLARHMERCDIDTSQGYAVMSYANK